MPASQDSDALAAAQMLPSLTPPWMGDEAFAESFSRHLEQRSILDATALVRVRGAAQKSGERLDRVAIKLGLLSEDDLYRELSRFLGVGLVEAEGLPKAPVLEDVLDREFVRRSGVLPIEVSDTILRLALVDPASSEQVRAVRYLSGRSIQVDLIRPALFEKAIQSIYSLLHVSGDETQARETRSGSLDSDVEKLRELANEAPIIRLVGQLVAAAVEAGASDIHIEPDSTAVRVRWRIDGVLRTVQSIGLDLRAVVTSRLKIMSKLDIAERRVPQDGRVRLGVRGVDVDFRLSTIPTMHGESVVLRILDRRNVELDFLSLGLSDETAHRLREIARQPNGIMLVTGPTGSGKTTTLYTLLKELNSPGVKILTVEDPIEYQLEGTNQIQVQPAIGLDFPSALRSILRQDPDIIMIGEIRDSETARIAIQAALTGHLVLSTLHTNSAVAAITRLLDMGIENYLIAATLRCVLAQRLVRKRCAECQSTDRRAATFAHIEGWERDAERSSLSSCPKCSGTGFSGRTTISELLVVDHSIRDLILSSASERRLAEAATSVNMRSLFDDGMLKVERGDTTLEEVVRVAREEAR
jgi:general secretion pathway protein E